MNQKTYINAVCKQLKCTKGKKQEIAKQLESDIVSALEQGETMDAICERMGSAKEVAAEFNENMPEGELKKVKKNRIVTVVGIIVAILLGLSLLAYWMFPKTKAIEDSKIFTAEQVEEKAMAVVMALYAEDYDLLQNEYASDSMKSLMTKENMDAGKSQLNVDWSADIAFGTSYITVVKQIGKEYAVVEMRVTYGEQSVIYTISFDSDYKLAGLYMR